MGWRGTVRTMNAMARESERNARRRQREQERYERELEKLEELDRAQYEVEHYDQYLERITSLHLHCSLPFDWMSFVDGPIPLAPELSTQNEDSARYEWEHYSPGFFAKLFGQAEKNKQKLFDKIEDAKRLDQSSYENQVEDHKDWLETQELARKVMDSDPQAYIEAVQKIDPFSEISELGSYLNISSHENGLVHVRIRVHGEDVIPAEKKSLLKSGKLSLKQMPKGMFYEYYQDYVCGCVLRVGRELLALLPIEELLITAEDNLLNTATGHLEEQPILSVRIPRETCNQLNIEAIDPSDSMRNFVHNMDFKKTKGFSPVEALGA